MYNFPSKYTLTEISWKKIVAGSGIRTHYLLMRYLGVSLLTAPSHHSDCSPCLKPVATSLLLAAVVSNYLQTELELT